MSDITSAPPSGAATPMSRSGSISVPAWVPDSDAPDCMSCGSLFTITRRRHHCRNCGWCVCSSCSSHKFILKHRTTSNTPQRVCNACFDSLSRGGPGNPAVMNAEEEDNEDEDSEEENNDNNGETNQNNPASPSGDNAPKSSKPRKTSSTAKKSSLPLTAQNSMLPLSIPSWTYAFKPFCGDKGQSVGIGRLYAKVVEASDLPPVDMFDSADPYVILRLVSSSKRTRVLERTLNPKWNQEFLLEVTNATDTLLIQVMDKQVGKLDILVAEAAVPLQALSHGQKVDKWLTLHLNPEAQAKGKSLGTQALSALNSVLNPLEWAQLHENYKKKKAEAAKRKKEEELKRRGQLTIPTENSSDGIARIHVELQYEFDKVGEFFSYFTPVTASRGKLKKKTAKREDEDGVDEDEDGSDAEEEEETEEEKKAKEKEKEKEKKDLTRDGKEKEPCDPFSLPDAYDSLVRLFSIFAPFVDGFKATSDLFTWNNPLAWLLAFILTFICSAKPWLLSVAVHLLVMRYIAWQHVYKVWVGGKPQVYTSSYVPSQSNNRSLDQDAVVRRRAAWRTKEHRAGSSGFGSSFFSSLANVFDSKEKEKERQKELLFSTMHPDEAKLQQILEPQIASAFLYGADLEQDVGWYQGYLLYWTDWIEYIYDLLNWTRPVETKILFIFVCFSLLFTFFGWTQYIVATIGTFFLIRFTLIGQYVEWQLVSAYNYYLATDSHAKLTKALKGRGLVSSSSASNDTNAAAKKND